MCILTKPVCNVRHDAPSSTLLFDSFSIWAQLVWQRVCVTIGNLVRAQDRCISTPLHSGTSNKHTTKPTHFFYLLKKTIIYGRSQGKAADCERWVGRNWPTSGFDEVVVILTLYALRMSWIGAMRYEAWCGNGGWRNGRECGEQGRQAISTGTGVTHNLGRCGQRKGYAVTSIQVLSLHQRACFAPVSCVCGVVVTVGPCAVRW